MGKLIDGVWYAEEPPQDVGDGRFRRADTKFHSWVTPDGRAGPTGEDGFGAEAGRYHLYAAINCPWAHRTLLLRRLKGLTDIVPLSLVRPRRTSEGWVFDDTEPRFRDNALGTSALHEVYTRARDDYTGRVTVPVLWDTARETIVSNESAEIVRMFNSAFDGVGAAPGGYYPENLRDEIDALNDRIYPTLNNGVYRAGFARTQEAYDEAVVEVFATLDFLEDRLATRRYLTGERLTEADWRLFPTLVRFDVAYHGAFKCNRRRIRDYPNLWGYARELYQLPGIAATVDLDVYKRGYYSPSPLRNPRGIVPLGPSIDFTAPHGRDALAAA